MFLTPALFMLGLGGSLAQAHFVQVVIRSAEGEKVSPISGMLLSSPSSGSGKGEQVLQAVQSVSTLRNTEEEYWAATWGVYRNVGASKGTVCTSFPCEPQEKKGSQGGCLGGLCGGSEKSKSKNLDWGPIDIQSNQHPNDWTLFNWGKANAIVKERAVSFRKTDENFYSRLAYLGYTLTDAQEVQLFWPKVEIPRHSFWNPISAKYIRLLTFNGWDKILSGAANSKNEYEEYDLDIVRPTSGSTMYACYSKSSFDAKDPQTIPLTLWQNKPNSESIGKCEKVALKARVIISTAQNFQELKKEEAEKKSEDDKIVDEFQQNARLKSWMWRKERNQNLKPIKTIKEEHPEWTLPSEESQNDLDGAPATS